MTALRTILPCLMAALLGTATAVAGDKPRELYFGSVAMDIPAAMHMRLRPLTDYLSKALRRPVLFKLSSDLSKAADAVATGTVDIAYLTPVAYLKAHRLGNVRLVAKTVTVGRSSFRLMIATRAGSPIKNVSDLAGRSFAFGDPAAVLQRAVVVSAGLPLERLGPTRFLGHYDNIARGIAAGDFDAGVLKDTTAYQWEKQGLRIIYASPELPPYNIVVSSRVDEGLYAAIRDAFLALDARNPAHLAVIKSLDKTYDGFAPTSDAEYDVVRKMIRPFQSAD